MMRGERRRRHLFLFSTQECHLRLICLTATLNHPWPSCSRPRADGVGWNHCPQYIYGRLPEFRKNEDSVVILSSVSIRINLSTQDTLTNVIVRLLARCSKSGQIATRKRKSMSLSSEQMSTILEPLKKPIPKKSSWCAKSTSSFWYVPSWKNPASRFNTHSIRSPFFGYSL